MRKVKFKKFWKYDGKWNVKEVDGCFHKWATLIDYKSNPRIEYTVALIEDFNGYMHEVAPKNVQFKDYNIITNAEVIDPIEKEFDQVMDSLKLILRMEDK